MTRPRRSTSTRCRPCSPRCACRASTGTGRASPSSADKEGWPAARFLAALAEMRDRRARDPTHPAPPPSRPACPAARPWPPSTSRPCRACPARRIEALAAGDWLETGANLIAIGNSGAGKTHLLCAIGHALVEAGYRVLYTRTTDLVQKLQAARRDLALESRARQARQASTCSSSTTSPTPRRTRPRPPSSSSSSPGATRPAASRSPPTSPSAPGTASSRTRPSPSPPSTASSTTRPSSR